MDQGCGGSQGSQKDFRVSSYGLQVYIGLVLRSSFHARLPCTPASLQQLLAIAVMVEGPKYHRHAELLRVVLKRRLKGVLRAESAQQLADFRSLIGCRTLEVFAVGKELFLLFGIRWDPQRRGGGLRFHFGHGGGYLVEQKPIHGDIFRWGPKSQGGGHCKQSLPAVLLEFSEAEADDESGDQASHSAGVREPAASPNSNDNGLRLLLWSDLGSSFSLAPPEYVRSVEARSAFDINANLASFALAEAVHLFRESEELVVDLIMDQSRLPGVGNIIKCEGLFAAGIFPLRRASELTEHEWTALLQELHKFSDLWYKHCQTSNDGQHMGCCHLMQVYGHKACSRCSCPVSLIKEGRRQRITYFCPTCQPTPGFQASVERAHRNELTVILPTCGCGKLPALLQIRAGNYAGYGDDRRPYLSCQRRRGSNYDDGGCGIPGPWNGCGFHTWLDEVVNLPNCNCQKPSLLRRVMSLRENGRYFLRCASRICRFRCWLKLTQVGAPEEPKTTGRWRRHAASTSALADGSSSNPETSSSDKDSQTVEEFRLASHPAPALGKPKRWTARSGYPERGLYSVDADFLLFDMLASALCAAYHAQAACSSTLACRTVSSERGRPKAGA